jgi:chemosensory pili system protein ChpA (sensor histidine kinase/response regulator)
MLNLRSDAQANPKSPFAGDREIAELARKLRSRFQLALLGWIRGEKVDENLNHLAEIALQFEQAASTKPVFQLWWVVGAVLEALRSGGVDANVSIKRLLGHVDREMKRLTDLGEARYAATPPADVLNNLLYYVAQSTRPGPRTDAVRESFGLHDVVASNGPEVVEPADTLSAPSVRLMRTVAAAIREDLTRVKDVLDIFVRKGATQVDDLAPQLEMLRKISDTLGVLGLGALRSRVENELESLKSIVERRSPPDDATLLGIASALIAVEDNLDSQLVRLILPEATPVGKSANEPTDEEFRLVQEAVLRECIVNMARIKEAVTHSLSAPAEAQGLDQVPQLVRGITAGLLMLGKQRAVDVMENVGRALGRVVRPDATLTPARLERMADAIVAVEYYMEMLQAGRADQWQMLDAAEARLNEVEPAAARGAPQPEPTPATVPAVDRSQRVVPLFPTVPVEPSAAPAAVPPVAAAARPVVAPPTVVDPEFLAVFVEEARENVARLEALFPQWEQSPLDVDALRDLRRAFHTLKGSGRMVGASRVGEFSWSVESLLNRVIEATLARTPDIVAVVRDAVAVMPSLVDEIDTGRPAAVDVAGIMARADAISGREGPPLPGTAVPLPAAPTSAAGELQPPPGSLPESMAPASGPAAAAEEAAPRQVETPTAAAVATESTMDPILRDIFRKETAGHIAVVRDYLARCARGIAPYPVTEALYRACHTLSGIAKTAGARQGIKVAEPMEHHVRKLHDNGRGLDAEAVLLLQDTVRLLETVAENVDENTGFFPEQGRLAAGWWALDRALDAELAHLAEAAERTLAETWEAEPPSLDEVEPSESADQGAAGGVVAAEEPLAGGGVVAVEQPVAVEPPAIEGDWLPTMIVPAPAWPEEPVAVEAPAAPAAVSPAVSEVAPPFELHVPTVEDEEFDADIAAIFGEEATELLEQAEGAFASWRADRADRSRVTELKRLLHTLKGGARMAGIRAMGDLSHEVESFLELVESDATRGDAATLDVLQASLDELHRMREMANSGLHIPPATELMARIRAAGAAPVPVVEQPPTPVVAEVAQDVPVVLAVPVAPVEPVEPAMVEVIETESPAAGIFVEESTGTEPALEPAVGEATESLPPAGVEILEGVEGVEGVKAIGTVLAEASEDAAPTHEAPPPGTWPHAAPVTEVAGPVEAEAAPAAVAPPPLEPPAAPMEIEPAATERESATRPAMFAPIAPAEPSPFQIAAAYAQPVLPGREPVAPVERVGTRARRRRTARPAAQQRRRGQHLPRAPRAADDARSSSISRNSTAP